MFTLSPSKKRDAVLLIDITEDNINACIVKEEQNKPVVLASYERDLLPHQKEKESYFSAVLEALQSALTELIPNPASLETVFFLPPDLYAADFLKIKEERSKPFVVSRSLITNSIEKSVAEKGSFIMSDGGGRALPIEQRLTHITLNGYRLADPYGKKTPQIELSLFLAVSGEEYLQKLKSLISTFTNHNRVLFFARPVAFAASLYHHLYTNPGTFLLFITEKNKSTLVSIEEGHLIDVLTIPFGKEDILLGLAKQLGILPAELEEGLTSKNKSSARETGSWWKGVIQVARTQLIPFFETIADKSFLSKKICVIGTDIDIAFWQDIFQEGDFWVGTDLFRGISQKETALPEFPVFKEEELVINKSTTPLSTALILGALFLTTVGEV